MSDLLDIHCKEVREIIEETPNKVIRYGATIMLCISLFMIGISNCIYIDDAQFYDIQILEESLCKTTTMKDASDISLRAEIFLPKDKENRIFEGQRVEINFGKGAENIGRIDSIHYVSGKLSHGNVELKITMLKNNGHIRISYERDKMYTIKVIKGKVTILQKIFKVK